MSESKIRKSAGVSFVMSFISFEGDVLMECWMNHYPQKDE